MKIDVRSLFFSLPLKTISTKGTNQEVSENIRSGKISPFDFSNACLTSKLVIKSCDIFRFAGQQSHHVHTGL